MSTLPFSSVQEAKENGKLLQRLLAYHLINNPKTNEPFSLQQTYELMANLYGFHGWPGLAEAIEAGCKVEYLDESRSDEYRQLASRLGKMLGLQDLDSMNRLYASFGACEFGCMESTRERAVSQHFFCKDYLQAGRIDALNYGYNRQSRYNHMRTTYDVQLLEHSYKLAVAKEFGLARPRKPSRPRISR